MYVPTRNPVFALLFIMIISTEIVGKVFLIPF